MRIAPSFHKFVVIIRNGLAELLITPQTAKATCKTLFGVTPDDAQGYPSPFECAIRRTPRGGDRGDLHG